ncbi:DUF86 domain-containing protein [Clostridia bacterium]|nr:DUF86 domain-containing protein [Clostridia bacterium]
MDEHDYGRICSIKAYCEDALDLMNRFGRSIDDFTDKKEYYYSISMIIYQIGELSGGLSDEFKEETKNEIPWTLIRGMRNRFAHTYDRMNKADIWDTMVQDVPVLYEFCEKMTKKQESARP